MRRLFVFGLYRKTGELALNVINAITFTLQGMQPLALPRLPNNPTLWDISGIVVQTLLEQPRGCDLFHA